MDTKRAGFIIGAGAFVALCVLPPFDAFLTAARDACNGVPGTDVNRLAVSMQVVLAVAVLMVSWWVTEAVPLPVTALLPAVVLPAMHVVGIQHGAIVSFTPAVVFSNYAHPVIFLFLGGFLLACAMRKWGLDRRWTLWLLTRGNLAESSRLILLGIMAMTAFLSMWMSNTAVAAMMLPLGMGILQLVGVEPRRSRFGTALMLGIAWSSSIGGVGTIIGTPPNGIALGILNTTFQGTPSSGNISFLEWMSFGVPFIAVMIPAAWAVLLLRLPPEVRKLPGGKEKLEADRAAAGTMTRGERTALCLFLAAVLLWLTVPFKGLLFPPVLAERFAWIDEFHVGLIAGTAAFLIPVHWGKRIFLLDWSDTRSVDWGTLILFGGGIALSDAMFKTGLAPFMASSFIGAFGTPSPFLLLAGIVLFMEILTEITSNTAVTSMFVPVIIPIASASGADPMFFSIAAAVAASMAFMLPVATPPNAIVYGSGFIRLQDMFRNGFFLDLVGWAVIVLLLPIFGGWFTGVFRF
ncbi:MAG: DASS family sodium-coupled anion symporter [Bacteroidota bacterium]|nr:DASS family sodium-coupled anion symporter [Bacteroidota bacterium]